MNKYLLVLVAAASGLAGGILSPLINVNQLRGGSSGRVLTDSGTKGQWSTPGGDVTGAPSSSTVVGLQTRPVSSSAPSSGDSLKWNGSAWAPGTVSSLPSATSNQLLQYLSGAWTATSTVGIGTAPTGTALTIDNSVGTGTGPLSIAGAVLVKGDSGHERYDAVGSSGGSTGFQASVCSGTVASPSATTASLLNFIAAGGYDGSSWTGNKAYMGISAAETWTSTAQGCYFTWLTTPIGSTSRFEAMRLTDAGKLLIGTTTAGATLTVNGGIGGNVQSINTSTTLTASSFMVFVNLNGGARTITLPPATNKGQMIILQRTDNIGGGSWSIAAAPGDTINGAATKAPTPTRYNMFIFVADGTSNWAASTMTAI